MSPIRSETSDIEIITEPLGGSPLAQLAQNGAAPPEWFGERPASVTAWRARIESVRANSQWRDNITAAFEASGEAAARLTRAVGGGGVAVTTGQQPGLFGGPVYTWSKAMSALALADELEAATGVPTVPVFWAATDDSDFKEASTTWIACPGGARELRLVDSGSGARSMSAVPLGDVGDLLAELEAASGSVADLRPLASARRAYTPSATVGSAYVALLRDLLEPLGIVVLDASHEAVVTSARPLLESALTLRSSVENALRNREKELSAQGMEPQVSEVAGRTLVFRRDGEARARITFKEAERADDTDFGALSPNVLLRPVVERFILPTVAYVAGPGELAYFAQVSAVAGALGASAPLAVPRWSATLIEPAIRRLLSAYDLTPNDFAEANRVFGRLARAAWPEPVAGALTSWREALIERADALRRALDGQDRLFPETPVEGALRGMTHRLDRLERRINAAVKHRESKLAFDLGTLEGALYPGGARQERAMNLLPLLARHGLGLLDRMRDAAREHARSLVLSAEGVRRS